MTMSQVVCFCKAMLNVCFAIWDILIIHLYFKKKKNLNLNLALFLLPLLYCFHSLHAFVCRVITYVDKNSK